MTLESMLPIVVFLMMAIVGIAALLALATFQQPEFAAFGALFVLLQSPVLILALLLRRRIPDSPDMGAMRH